MKICLFTPTFLPLVGGAERDADIIVRGLIDRGHEVHVLAQRNAGSPSLDVPYPVSWYRRPPMQHLWPELLTLPLRRLHRAWPFDVVLAFYSYPTGYAASVIRDKLEVSLVTSPRGADLYPMFHELCKPRVRGLIARGYQRSDRIVSISEWITQRLREVAGENLPPIDLVYNGIDLEAHDAARDASRADPPDLPVDEPFVLHLARVAPVKQQTLAVEGVHRVRDLFQERGWQYAIVGDGNGMAEVRAMVERYDLEPVVRLLGTRTGLEKAWLYDNAEFMVSTSREEGLGNVTIEAMASGLPMLASDIGPHQELIGRRGWGMLFRSGDVDDFVDKLRTMMDQDQDHRRATAMQQRERFSLEAMIDGYERACLHAVESRAAKPANELA